MKKWMIVMLIAILSSLVLSGCTEKSDDDGEIDTPEEAVRDMFSAVDEGDYERWTEYFIYSNGSSLNENESRREEQINSMIVRWGRKGELIEVNILSIERIREENINNDFEPFTRYWLRVETEFDQEGNVSRSTENFTISHLEFSGRWVVGSYDDGEEKDTPFTTMIYTKLIAEETGAYLRIENLGWNYYHWERIRILIDGEPIHVKEAGSTEMIWDEGICVTNDYMGEKETQEIGYLVRSDGSYLGMEIGSTHTVSLERTEDDFLFWETDIVVEEA
ncbi:MAG: hypothetical protein ACMUIG_04270 [Thermoplasmatota archaeon]